MILDKVYNNLICEDKPCRMKNCFNNVIKHSAKY